jgi:uncharacterized protein YihD (DUF1040 family)
MKKREIEITNYFKLENITIQDLFYLPLNKKLQTIKKLKGIFFSIQDFILQRPDIFHSNEYFQNLKTNLYQKKHLTFENKKFKSYFEDAFHVVYKHNDLTLIQKKDLNEDIEIIKKLAKENQTLILKEYLYFLDEKTDFFNIYQNLKEASKFDETKITVLDQKSSNKQIVIKNLKSDFENVLKTSLTKGFFIKNYDFYKLSFNLNHDLIYLICAYLNKDKEELIQKLKQIHTNNSKSNQLLSELVNPFFEYEEISFSKIIMQSFKASKSFNIKLPKEYIAFMTIMLKEDFKNNLKGLTDITQDVIKELNYVSKGLLRLPDYVEKFTKKEVEDEIFDRKIIEKRTLIFSDSLILFITSCFMFLIAFFSLDIKITIFNLSAISLIAIIISFVCMGIILKKLIFELYD